MKLLGNGFVSTKRHGRAKNKINDSSAFGQFLIWHHRQEEKHLGKQFLDKKVNLNPKKITSEDRVFFYRGM